MLTPMLVLLICVILAALGCVRRIPEGHAYTLRRLGGQMRTIGAGTHIVLPLLERVAHRIRLLGNVVTFQRLQIAQQRYSGSIYYQVLDAERADAVIDNVDNLVCGCLRGQLDGAVEDETSRNARLKAELNRQLGERGLLITRVQITGE